MTNHRDPPPAEPFAGIEGTASRRLFFLQTLRRRQSKKINLRKKNNGFVVRFRRYSALADFFSTPSTNDPEHPKSSVLSRSRKAVGMGRRAVRDPQPSQRLPLRQLISMGFISVLILLFLLPLPAVPITTLQFRSTGLRHRFKNRCGTLQCAGYKGDQ